MSLPWTEFLFGTGCDAHCQGLEIVTIVTFTPIVVVGVCAVIALIMLNNMPPKRRRRR
jgi:hypothetical protein